MELLLVPLGCTVALLLGAAAGQTPISRRGPHHPRGEPLPPGAHAHHVQPAHKLTQDAALMHDTAHLQEDLGRPLEDMSDEELEFHYFNLHDFDGNKLLDGLEMLKAVYHTLDHDHHEEVPTEDEDSVSHTSLEADINRYIELIDKVLDEDDLDKDGYISYPEFALGRANGRQVDLTSKIAGQV